MQDVLWPGCEWKKLTMSDVLTNDGVRMWARKAMTVLNPDKAWNSSDPHKRYISERVFNAIKNAFDEHKVRFVTTIIAD